MSANKNETDIHHQSMEIIETPRLFLRPWQEADAAALHKYASNKKIAHDAGWRAHTDEIYSLTVIRLMLLRATAFALTEKDAVDETIQSSLKKADSLSKSGCVRTVICNDDILPALFQKEPIGGISLYTGESISRGRAADEGDLGYWLGEPFHNRGYMTEAVRAMMAFSFDNFHVSGLWCSHYEGNEASKAVILKAGFEEHHILRNSYNPMLEAYFTELFYYISKSNYQKVHKLSLNS